VSDTPVLGKNQRRDFLLGKVTDYFLGGETNEDFSSGKDIRQGC
jgi:hypothetical protein